MTSKSNKPPSIYAVGWGKSGLATNGAFSEFTWAGNFDRSEHIMVTNHIATCHARV